MKLSVLSKLRALRGNKCEECGETLKYKVMPKNKNELRPNLEFAHIKPTELIGKKRELVNGKDRVVKQDILAHPDHFKLLCFKCHFRLDYGRDHPNPPKFTITIGRQ